MGEVSTPEDQQHPENIYSALTVRGLLAIALGSLFLSVFEPIAGVPLVVLALLIACVMWKLRGWTPIVAAIFGFLTLLTSIGILIVALLLGGLVQFLPQIVLLSIGALMASVGGSVAFVRHTRGELHASATRVEWRVFYAATVLAIVASTFGVASTVQNTIVWGQAKAETARIVSENLRFEPNVIEVPADKAFNLVLRNDAWNLHAFRIEGLDGDYLLMPRRQKLIQFPPTIAGTYVYSCPLPGHEAMKGYLIVK